MTASKNVDVHYVSIPNVITRVQLHVHIQISFENIGSHFVFIQIA